MSISFKVLGLRENPSSKLRRIFQLSASNWDDYSFETSFGVSYYDELGNFIQLGGVKIGYKEQAHGKTRDAIKESFDALPDGWFSLGQDVEYYKNIYKNLSKDLGIELLKALKDVVADDLILEEVKDEKVFRHSLMRGLSYSVVGGQYKRVLNGYPELTNFNFIYAQDRDDKHAQVELEFKVDAESKPSTNVHVLIGRNGVGKTTLLNNMVCALLGIALPEQPQCLFYERQIFLMDQPLSKEYFSSVVSVSFSAFDPFLPPMDRKDGSAGPAYIYIGMKNARSGQSVDKVHPPKTDADLVNDFVNSFRSCLSQQAKRDRWLKAIKRLESDSNFEDMNLARLANVQNDTNDKEALRLAGAMASRMSSGHSIVLLTITKLVDTVKEKTLVLLDEPESHLHPPLLAAFTRALSDLLYSRNGVAIVATHSPVVLQEVPKSCVWKLTRRGREGRSDRPERETFGENVGVLTREIFGLEVTKSGFHEMLQSAVDSGKSFDEIIGDYDGQLGVEAKAILLSLIAARDANKGDDL
jgi:predicted ATPase